MQSDDIIDEIKKLQEEIMDDPSSWGNDSEVEGAIQALEILLVRLNQ